MRGFLAKKLRKYAKKESQRHWVEYVKALQQWPFKARLRFCWFIMKGKKKEKMDKEVL